LADFNGSWTINWTGTTHCKIPGGSYNLTVTNGVVTGRQKSGSIAASGAVRWRSVNRFGNPVDYRGTFQRDSGSGRFSNVMNECGGTFTAKKN
jgi:hypothetical protein